MLLRCGDKMSRHSPMPESASSWIRPTFWYQGIIPLSRCSSLPPASIYMCVCVAPTNDLLSLVSDWPNLSHTATQSCENKYCAMEHKSPSVPITSPVKRKVACQACRSRKKVVSSHHYVHRVLLSTLTEVLANDTSVISPSGENPVNTAVKGVYPAKVPSWRTRDSRNGLILWLCVINLPFLVHCFFSFSTDFLEVFSCRTDN